jgi:hypothetical protein
MSHLSLSLEIIVLFSIEEKNVSDEGCSLSRGTHYTMYSLFVTLLVSVIPRSQALLNDILYFFFYFFMGNTTGLCVPGCSNKTAKYAAMYY